MTDSTVTERRIRLIETAFDAGNWKQALKECEKWQKKGETSDRFLALKAAILIQSPDAKQYDKGVQETLQLCRKTPAVTDLDAIDKLERCLDQLSLSADEGPKLWERAAAAKPSDEKIVVTWLHTSMFQSNWPSAQKATTSLKKTFPQERRYDFWNILMCYLIHEDPSMPEKDRKLFGTLANRMISKAAQAGGTDKGISSPEELSLLAAVLTKTGSAKDLVQLLQGESLKSVVESDLPHAKTLLLSALSMAQDESSIWTYCNNILFINIESTEPSRDDRDWTLLTKHLVLEQTREDVLKLIDGILAKYPNHRQGLLAKIDLLTSIKDKDTASTQVLETCKAYYDLYGTKAFSFDELIPRLAALEPTNIRSFRSMITTDDKSSTTDPILKLFELKLDYYLTFRDDFSPADPVQIADRAIDLAISSDESQPPVPEAVVLAVLAILLDAATSADTTLVMQANMILHGACIRYKDYYPLRVLLIQVQILSGQIHLAMQNFLELNIKNLQWESIGYLLLTRISSLHPHQYGQGENACNPLGALEAAISFFVSAHKSMDKAIRQGLDHQNYSNVIDTIALKSKLEASMMHQIYMIEQRKCLKARNLGVKPGLSLYQGELTDLRDASFMPKYGLTDGKVESFLRIGPTPLQGWIHANNMHEHLLSFLMAELTGDRGLCKITFENLVDILDRASAATPDMTEQEQLASIVHRGLCAIIVQINSNQPGDAKALMHVIGWLGGPSQKATPAVINEIEYPDWKYLHTQFVRLETLQTIGHFSAVMLNSLKVAKDRSKVIGQHRESLQELRKLVDDQVKSIHDDARTMKQNLNASGVLGKLVDSICGRTNDAEHRAKLAERIQKFQDEAAIEEYCGLVRESWEDALDGILATKVKTI